jgi:peptidoglycan/xylan/chitin deacetylase (PgdA/CDA1 family)
MRDRKKTKLKKWLAHPPGRSLLGNLSHAVSIERFGPKLSERVFWRADIDEPRIALTFDDGPHALSTPRILGALQDFDVPATFFLVGKNVKAHLPVARDIVKAGHEIGNHTYNHVRLSFLSNANIMEEITRTDDLLRNMDGVEPRFLRPPFGLFTNRVLNIVEGLGYQTVVGDVYPRDPHHPGKKKIVERVVKKTEPGSIIILHDGGNTWNVDRSQTVEAIKEIIPQLKEKGFIFMRLSDLLL